MFKHIASLFAKSWSLATPGEKLLEIFGASPSTSSGVAITPETALRVPSVACAVRTIAESVAQLPVHLYRRDEQTGAKARATDHPAYALIHDDANEWTSAYELKLAIMVDALVRGNGYAFVNRVGGEPREIIRLDPGTVRVDLSMGAPRYFVRQASGEREIAREDVIHIRALSLDGAIGKSPVNLAAEAIGIALAQEGHAGRIFGNGGRPSGVLKAPGKLSAQAADRLRQRWGDVHAGGASGKTAVLEEGMDFVPLTFTSVDLQFLELRSFQVIEIARAFRVPPHLLFELGRATWANSEEMGRVFLTYTLMPWLKQWEGALRRALFTREERSTHFAEFLVDDFARADLESRASAYSSLIAARVLNPNEARAMENRAPYEGGEAFINPHTMPAAGDEE
ncbi:MAG: phage portal protein [Salinarimonadaceae bacterium]|nr:MAG: phage portal protein [Salinarimonadaceae bacterium]